MKPPRRLSAGAQPFARFQTTSPGQSVSTTQWLSGPGFAVAIVLVGVLAASGVSLFSRSGDARRDAGILIKAQPSTPTLTPTLTPITASFPAAEIELASLRPRGTAVRETANMQSAVWCARSKFAMELQN